MQILSQLSQFFSQIAPFAITGIIVSGAVQWLKKYLDKTGHKVALLVGASVVLGSLAYFFGAIPENVLTAIAGVLASANLIYVLFVQWFESPAPVNPVDTTLPPTPSA